MRPNPHRPTNATRAAIVRLSHGTCYWQPLCPELITRRIGKDHVLNLDFAHICAAEPGGPRYDNAMTDAQRRHFDNLILLCRAHHKIVDQLRPKDFPVVMLRQWKAEREADDAQALAALGQVTEASLQQIISAAIGEHDQQLRQVLGRLERNDAEAAQMLRDILRELDGMRHNFDQAEQLSEAARRLYLIQGEGLASQLERAGDRLYMVFAEGLAAQLSAAADKLNNAANRYGDLY
jgi:hypothetical protein